MTAARLGAPAALRSVFETWPVVGVEALNEVAELQARIDRKYLVDEHTAAEVLAAVDGELLVIGGRTTFEYRSRYFDTADRLSFRLAASGNRRRFKVRTRVYVDQATCMLEIKVKGMRGVTVKHRAPWSVERADDIGDIGEVGDVYEVLASIGRCGVASALLPSVATRYERSTVLLRGRGDVDSPARLASRATIDSGLCWLPAAHALGHDVGWRSLGSGLIVETKSAGPPTALDLALWQRGARPIRVSKFALACLADDPTLAGNRWHRARQRLDASPDA